MWAKALDTKVPNYERLAGILYQKKWALPTRHTAACRASSSGSGFVALEAV